MGIQKHFEFANNQAKEGHFFKDKALPPIQAAINEFARSGDDEPVEIGTMVKEEAKGGLIMLFAPMLITTGIVYGAAGKAVAYVANLAKGPN